MGLKLGTVDIPNVRVYVDGGTTTPTVYITTTIEDSESCSARYFGSTGLVDLNYGVYNGDELPVGTVIVLTARYDLGFRIMVQGTSTGTVYANTASNPSETNKYFSKIAGTVSSTSAWVYVLSVPGEDIVIEFSLVS